jgi:hypothetical protein
VIETFPEGLWSRDSGRPGAAVRLARVLAPGSAEAALDSDHYRYVDILAGDRFIAGPGTLTLFWENAYI